MINKSSKPDKNNPLAIRSNISARRDIFFRERNDKIEAAIKNTIETVASSSITVPVDLLKNRKDVITKKQKPIRLDEAFNTCGERGSFIFVF